MSRQGLFEEIKSPVTISSFQNLSTLLPLNQEAVMCGWDGEWGYGPTVKLPSSVQHMLAQP